MKLLWIDCEMTGLDLKKDTILELAAMLTDINLNIIYAKEWQFKTNKNHLLNMNQQCKEMHTKSGLCKLVEHSEKKHTDAENEIINILQKNTDKNNVFLAGNSVHYDKAFIDKFMPKITTWTHYRIFDVSTLKILYFMKHQKEAPLKKERKHRAINDIKESIKEFKYYSKHLISNQ
jgi:oligoribonuclease